MVAADDGPGAEPAEAAAAWVTVVGLVVLVATGLLSAVLELLFIPLYAGSVVMPVAVLGAIVGNVLLPRLARSLGATGWRVALPFLAWLLPMFIAVLVPRPEGDVLVPGGSLTWVSYGVLLGGTIAGTVTLVVTGPPPVRTAPPPAGNRVSR